MYLNTCIINKDLLEDDIGWVRMKQSSLILHIRKCKFLSYRMYYYKITFFVHDLLQKSLSTTFDNYQIFIFNQMIALQKLWKMFFVSPKKLFLFSRFLYFHLPLFCSLSAIAAEVVWRKILNFMMSSTAWIRT